MAAVTMSAVAMGVYHWLNQPRIVAHTPSIDVGNVEVGSSGMCEFEIENTGLFPVQIEPAASP